MEYIALVVIAALIEYMVFMGACGRARMTYKIYAPVTTGNEIFERYFRVQQNTLEQLIIFIPAIFLCGWLLHAPAAAVIGLFFILGRAIYFKAYIADPAKRGPGMIIGFLANILLLAGALFGAVSLII